MGCLSAWSPRKHGEMGISIFYHLGYKCIRSEKPCVVSRYYFLSRPSFCKHFLLMTKIFSMLNRLAYFNFSPENNPGNEKLKYLFIFLLKLKVTHGKITLELFCLTPCYRISGVVWGSRCANFSVFVEFNCMLVLSLWLPSNSPRIYSQRQR